MRLEFKVSPAVENMDSTGMLDTEESSRVQYVIGCSRLQLNLVIVGALRCMNFDSFYGAL